ncbi:sensor histidine kinase, partial [Staphylococcus cohnii]
VALIANELITNCLTHAFNNQTEGIISVVLAYDTESDTVKLEVQDTGEEESAFQPSFGLKIVTTIAENDLEGTFNIDRNSIGTIGKVEFQHKGVD